MRSGPLVPMGIDGVEAHEEVRRVGASTGNPRVHRGCLVAVSIASGCGGSGGAADRGLSDGLVPPFAKALGCQTQSYAFGTLSRLTTCAYSGRASTAAMVRYVENRLPTGGSLHTDPGPAQSKTSGTRRG
jgi:hypothetical protein